MIEFAHPWFLALPLAVVPLLALVSRPNLVGAGPAARRWAFALRLALVTAIAAALSGARVVVPRDDLSVIFALDLSASVPDEAASQAAQLLERALASAGTRATIGAVGFAQRPRIWRAPAPARPGEPGAPPPFTRAERLETDLGRAMEFCAAIFPAGATRRIALLSDGNDTVGAGGDTAARLAREGIEIHALKLERPGRPEVLVESVEMPTEPRRGEPIPARVRLVSNVATDVEVRLHEAEYLVRKQRVRLPQGTSTVEFHGLKPAGRFVVYEAEIQPRLDTVTENNRARAMVAPGGDPRVLLLDPDEETLAPLAGALRAAGFAVETRDADGLPRSLAELQQFDLLLLSDMPAAALGPGAMERIARWVRDLGGALALAGGERAFGAGGYRQTPLETILPVRVDLSEREESPSVALVIALDRSGSMQAEVGGQTKLALACQASTMAMDLLRGRDQFGLLAVDTRAHVVVPLSRVEGRAAKRARILSLAAGGGGIYAFTALKEAAGELRRADTRVRHVILFCDAADVEEKTPGATPGGGGALEIVSSLFLQGATTSVIALGQESDRDTAFLRLLAEQGGGRFYLTADPLALPQIFSAETIRISQSSLVEEPALVLPAAKNQATDGIDWTRAPFLLGYNVTRARPTADLLLRTESGEPILATWRYGLGQVAAFTSDVKARWAAEWIEWSGFAQLWTQLCRTLMRSPGDSPLQVRIDRDERGVDVEIDAADPDGSFLNALAIRVTRSRENAPDESLNAHQIAPGHYRASFRSEGERAALFSVHAPALGAPPRVLGLARGYPEEFLRLEPDPVALGEIARRGGGALDPDLDTLLRPPDRRVPHRVPLATAFLALAALLLPADLYARRRAWREAPTPSAPDAAPPP